jgi:hypothetical protein
MFGDDGGWLTERGKPGEEAELGEAGAQNSQRARLPALC